MAALHRVRLTVLLIAGLGFAQAVGCKPEPEVRRYRALKPHVVNELNPGKPADRMLGAIIPQGDAWWFVKMAGPTEAVKQQLPAFESLVKSIRFSTEEPSQPAWKLPTGWSQQSGASAFRFATLTTGGKQPLEVTVTTLPRNADDEAGQILANVNRWRGQMKLKPIVAGELSKCTRPVPYSSGTATLFDVEGTLQTGGMPPFAAPRPGN